MSNFEEKHNDAFHTCCKYCQFEEGHSLRCIYYKEVPMPKLSEVFEGENSSLRKTFDEAARPMSFEEKLNEVVRQFENTKFAKNGGACFECCDFESMVEECKTFIRTALTQCREDTVREEIEVLTQITENAQEEGKCGGFYEAIDEAKQSLLKLIK